MVKFYFIQNIYKKWSFMSFLNNLIYWNIQMTVKKIWFLKIDFSKHIVWGYKKYNIITSNYIKKIYKLFLI